MGLKTYEYQFREFQSVDGYPLSVQTVGYPSLPPLILLHGEWQSRETFRQQVAQLSTKWYLVLPDLRGHGMSGKPLGREAYTKEFFASDLLTIQKGLGFSPVALYAASRLARLIIGAALSSFGREEVSCIFLEGRDTPLFPLHDQYCRERIASSDPNTNYVGILSWFTPVRLESDNSQFWEAVARGRLVPQTASQELVRLFDDPLCILHCWPEHPFQISRGGIQ